jgi:hypothetical protein
MPKLEVLMPTEARAENQILQELRTESAGSTEAKGRLWMGRVLSALTVLFLLLRCNR